MIKPDDILICIENLHSIYINNRNLPLFKFLHVKNIDINEFRIEFKEYENNLYYKDRYIFITPSEYRKFKLNRLNNQ